jgi:signal transduction histidine kinase
MKRKAVFAGRVGEDPHSAAVQDIDDFIYLMSHDVRASVRALIELPQWIEEDLAEAGVALPDSVAQSMEMMHRHTARLDRMLVDLLAYSRVGRMQDVACIDIAASLEEVIAALNLPQSMIIERDLECSHVMMGAEDIGTLWSALIGNAVKHHNAPAGRITASTRQDGTMIRLTVSDDGPGIPDNLHTKAMSALITLRPRDEVEGTGMGLANVRKIATHYGGHLKLSKNEKAQGGLRVDVVIPHRL